MSGKGSSYRPICDSFLLAPSKVGYYGAYPNGFLQRARCLLCRMDESLLHVCAGKVRDYPGYGFGHLDKTLDVNPLLAPDYCQDARQPWAVPPQVAILIDPPYTPADAAKYGQYSMGVDFTSILPTPGELLERAWEVLQPGGKVGLLHQFHPKLKKPDARLVAIIQVIQGAGQQPRALTIWEKECVYINKDARTCQERP